MKRLWHSRKIMWFAGLIAFALVAAACGDSEPAASSTTAPPATESTTTTVAPTTTTAAPVTATTEEPGKPYGGTVITSQAQEPPTLNGFVPGGSNFVVAIIANGYGRGVQRVNGFSLQYEPDLVTELPTVGNGGVVVNADNTMTISYTILDEAVWSDGTPITGEDFQFTLDTILDPDSQASTATYEDIVDSSFTDKTFTYTLAAPTVVFETIFSEIIPKHDVEGTNFLEDWNETRWSSNGPFIFDEWAKGEFVRIVRNDNYFKNDPETGQALPFLDEVIFRFIGETEGELNAFAARETDVVQPDPNTDVIERLQGLTGEGAVVEVLSGPIWEHLNFNFNAAGNRNPETFNANLNFRKAIAHAVNKQLLVDDILAGQVEPLDSWVEAYNPQISNSTWSVYDYNPEKAAEFLAAACADEGRDCDANPVKVIFSTTSNNDARQKIAQILGENLTAIGIDYEQQLEDSSLFFGESAPNGTTDMQEWAWLGSPGLSGVVGILDIWDGDNPGPDGDNWYYWGTEGSMLIDEASERFKALRDEANDTVDEAELLALISEAEQILADNVVIIPLYARLTVMAVWADEVGGVKHHPTSQGYTWNLGEWYRLDM